MRNAEPVIEFIRKELNQSHQLFERDQQEEGLDQDKENDEKEGSFKTMSKLPHGSQKHKVTRIASAKRNDLEPSKEKRPALARRSHIKNSNFARSHSLKFLFIEGQMSSFEIKLVVSDLLLSYTSKRDDNDHSRRNSIDLTFC